MLSISSVTSFVGHTLRPNDSAINAQHYLSVVFCYSRDDAAAMIKDKISTYDIERIALFVTEDIQSSKDFDAPELIGMYLENIPGLESLSKDEIENLIITIESKVNEIQ